MSILHFISFRTLNMQHSHDDNAVLTRHAKIKDEEFPVNKNFDTASKIEKKEKKRKKENIPVEKNCT